MCNPPPPPSTQAPLSYIHMRPLGWVDVIEHGTSFHSNTFSATCGDVTFLPPPTSRVA